MSDSLVMIGAKRNGRKRKAAPKCQGKISPLSSPNMNPPKYKEMQTARGHEQNINGSRKLGEDAKPFEPPKDYIHIMARRGQATDNHSLAERVSKEHTFLREKISERMKLLQNLVPGCNKVKNFPPSSLEWQARLLCSMRSSTTCSACSGKLR
ncbi:hypothetical protein ZIOFF_002013 [Zingiber officinale]|uniref:Uncharacterized protein n=1 Tax=Zingiber officinale TaxID=94328 RepID=A0A8J5IAU2_ZINOF|nr:hypothetical protein ZIOFF_002013 [Zingiber officinale]